MFLKTTDRSVPNGFGFPIVPVGMKLVRMKLVRVGLVLSFPPDSDVVFRSEGSRQPRRCLIGLSVPVYTNSHEERGIGYLRQSLI